MKKQKDKEIEWRLKKKAEVQRKINGRTTRRLWGGNGARNQTLYLQYKSHKILRRPQLI